MRQRNKLEHGRPGLRAQARQAPGSRLREHLVAGAELAQACDIAQRGTHRDIEFCGRDRPVFLRHQDLLSERLAEEQVDFANHKHNPSTRGGSAGGP